MWFIRATFVLILATVLLHQAHSESTKKAVLMMVCTCGKPVLAILATPDGVMVEPLTPTPDLTKACKAKQTQIGDLVILRVETYTKDDCPISI